MPGAAWRRIAGFRVVVTWPQAGYAPPPSTPVSLRARLAGIAGALLIGVGTAAVGIAVASQVHAPQPSRSAAGATGTAGRGPSLARSLPVSVRIPAIGVDSHLLHLGLNRDGTIKVPSIQTSADKAAWYKYSATPGQVGASVIEGHVDIDPGPGRLLPPRRAAPGQHHRGDARRRGHRRVPRHGRPRVRQVQVPGARHLRRPPTSPPCA